MGAGVPQDSDSLLRCCLLLADCSDLLVAGVLLTGKSTESTIETNFRIDLSHAFLVGSSNTAGSEHEIHLFEGELFGLRYYISD